MRKRKIRKIGNSYYVKLEQTDMKDLNLQVGDNVEVTKIMNFSTPLHETDVLECSKEDGSPFLKFPSNEKNNG